MEEHKLIIVELVNGFLRWTAGILGFPVKEGMKILPNHIVMAMIVTGVIILFFKLNVKNLSVREPGKMQNFLEMIYRFFQYLVDDMIGHEGRKFIPVLATLGLFIAVSNLLGLLPEMESPTAKLNTTVGCAIFIFFYYHYQGVKKHGLWGYIKTFMGPVWWLAWLFFPIEVVSHFSRPLSLSMRLFGNIFGEDLVIIIIASLVPFVAPLPVMALAVFTSLLQAFIFVMLSTIYLAGAMAEEH
ncbi:MAG: F0F1 ATP synthase subunit A [Candidatus Aminicenantes bacterium]|nr:F0F1 ATP synthase subunit A [Candidatus Aminicenantes bacterium]NIM77989.1 F0F1 ATP synthase subunit A [Candidatus Aminicenantes bacterium]NIN17311.1 F0F1 ATP synthase subunit A [Candidatus Aminicenantes bacterium]NIN41202.1 F0F1 ATP synthase subunit A [Candidatus Aminicenantes bacterium]NIN83977.1 F0F1 ATP synthase subunit A [Candidatus Aminicenantes bacterium]